MSFEEGEEVAGFVFSTLLERLPNKGPELKKLHDTLSEETAGEDSVCHKLKKITN